MRLKKQKKEVLNKWNKVKEGNYNLEEFKKDLEKYNNKLLFLYMAIFITIFIGLMVLYVILSKFNIFIFIAKFIVVGTIGLLITLILYQYKRIEIAPESIKKLEKNKENK